MLVSAVQQSEISHMGISIPSLGMLPPLNPIPLGHHGAPSWTPSAIEQLPSSYLFYTWQSVVYMSVFFSQFFPLSPSCDMSTWLLAKIKWGYYIFLQDGTFPCWRLSRLKPLRWRETHWEELKAEAAQLYFLTESWKTLISIVDILYL